MQQITACILAGWFISKNTKMPSKHIT